jgi:hypothetical protein
MLHQPAAKVRAFVSVYLMLIDQSLEELLSVQYPLCPVEKSRDSIRFACLSCCFSIDPRRCSKRLSAQDH